MLETPMVSQRKNVTIINILNLLCEGSAVQVPVGRTVFIETIGFLNEHINTVQTCDLQLHCRQSCCHKNLSTF